jgi:hypothetical protein
MRDIVRLISTTFLTSVLFSATACREPSSAPTGDTGDVGAPPVTVTYHRDVLPITQTHCNGCHTAGGIAAQALDSYENARNAARLMADAVEARRMPPWPASPACGGPFVGDRSLTPEQIRTIGDWAKQGAPEGSPADAPAAPVAPSGLERIDFTGAMEKPYTPTMEDEYRCFIVDPALGAAKNVVGYDIAPGARQVVHHVILYLVPRTAAQAKDAEDAAPGWSCFGGANVQTTGVLGAWAPGGAAVRFPAATGIRVGPDTVMAMQVHYNTRNGMVPDQTGVRLMFGLGSELPAALIPLVASGFRIPPGAKDHAFDKAFPNAAGRPVRLWGSMPHMHTHGKSIRLTVEPSESCVVDIPQWNFHWQNQYFRTSPLVLGAGDQLRLSCTWDNPTDRTLQWGEGTADEMCFAFVYVSP